MQHRIHTHTHTYRASSFQFKIQLRLPTPLPHSLQSQTRAGWCTCGWLTISPTPLGLCTRRQGFCSTTSRQVQWARGILPYQVLSYYDFPCNELSVGGTQESVSENQEGNSCV